MHGRFILLVLGLVFCSAVGRTQTPPLLLQEPTLSRDQIVFVFAGDLWRVSRQGGDAVRLTAHPGQERHPVFSPDGTQLAFTAEYDGNVDVYVMPAAGGTPVRLTSHPGDDNALGWSPDGQRVLFRSARLSPADNRRLFTVSVKGGPATELPLPAAEEGAFSPDGARLAYVPTLQWQRAWKRYRGGQTRPIWIASLADSAIEKLPRDNSNDFNPLWVGDTIYFLSDRNGPVTLFAFDPKTKAVRELVKNSGFDFKSVSAGPGALVYEQFGSLHLYDLTTGQSTPVAVHLAGDLAEVRPHFEPVEAKDLRKGGLSPTGQRAVFETRGEIVTLPAEKGDARNLTRTPGVAERDPSWSPDGRWIACFSDESGEYALQLRDPSGLGEVRKIPLGDPPSFFYSPTWSPDSKHLAYADKRLQIWLLNLEQGTPVKVDAHPFRLTFEADSTTFSWSPDSRWLAYPKTLPNRLGAIFIYSLADQRPHQVTDGLSDAAYPVFADGGQYLYFAASTDSGPAQGWGDLSAVNRPVTRSLYLAVLDRTVSSPLAPESDEEKPAAAKADTDKKESAKDSAKPAGDDKSAAADTSKDTNAPPVKIDFDHLGQRILALPLPAKNYKGLFAGKSNALWVLEGPRVDPLEEPAEMTLQKFDLGKRKAEKFGEGLKAFAIAKNGEKILFQKGDGWFLTGVESAPKEGDGALKLDGFQLAVEPQAEWRQMFRETWRIERDFFYDPGHHGLDLQRTAALYEPFLAGIGSRADLNYLFEEMLGEMTVGHMFIGGGDRPEVKKVKVGLLGADYTLENGRYRFARVFDGENWNPQLRAPLTEPGVNVVTGEYLLAVDGRDLTAAQELFALFQDKAGRLTTLRVGPNPDGSASREVKVKPVESERDLRHLAWIEDNRRTVDRLSQGRLAYVHLPDTGGGGYTSFNRYFFAQVDKQGFIIDERFNHGGYLADYVVDYLRRPVMNYAAAREGDDLSFPLGASAGPKVMLINEFAGSGGDALPWYFRKAGIGPLIGKRTWGGLVGIGGYPDLLDGGSVTAPHVAIYGTKGEWEVENIGVPPDIEVELDPQAWRNGHDLQLEKAVEVALEALAKNPPAKARRPAYPTYQRQ